jgi:hypothetical protein
MRHGFLAKAELMVPDSRLRLISLEILYLNRDVTIKDEIEG